MEKQTKEDIINIIRSILSYIGEDYNREGLKETPERIIKMWSEIFKGYDLNQKPKITTFKNRDNIKDIIFDSGNFYSMCEHHILPFFGKYYFAYIPNDRILGISKISRVVNFCSSKLQLQERLTNEIVYMLSEALNNNAFGFACVMKGKHLCKTMRGAKSNGNMCTCCFTGVFKDDANLRNEFYKLIEMQEKE